MKRSNEPKKARWMTKTGCSWLSAPMYVSPKRARHLRVELDRAELPGAAEHVGHVQVDLRPVERALALADEVVDGVPLERAHELALGEVPLLVGAELVVGPGRELCPRLEPEEAVDVLQIVERAVELGVDLLPRAEDVGVVLRHVADAREPVQRAGELVAVQRRGLGVAQRQVAIAPQRAAEEQHVPRAVHRLDREASAPRRAGSRNMFSRNFSQWPEVIQSAFS